MNLVEVIEVVVTAMTAVAHTYNTYTFIRLSIHMKRRMTFVKKE